jgi:ribosomal protein S18 acetylase RimI-like enzyme
MQFIENTVRNLGKDIIRLDVYDKSIQAINFYHKMGFIDLFKRPTRRFQVVCMEKRLK